MSSIAACAGKSAPEGQGHADTETTGIMTSVSDSDDDASSSGQTSTSDGDTSGASGDASTGSSAGTDTGQTTDSPTGGGGGSLDCGGKTYACGDGEDNDGDGHIDLQDPECTGPCDDDEGSFQTGIPGDNVDCKQDCFFDGNSGQGDDGCLWHLKCDPANPGEHIGCEYTGGNNCNNMPPNQTEGCIMFCQQFVPPGCDCFGCCTVQTPQGPVDIFLNGHPDCSLDNLDACTECTSQIEECGNPCEPEQCEVCFGETDPPEGCDEQTCDNELPCAADPDCPTDYFCYLGCCFPPPPG